MLSEENLTESLDWEDDSDDEDDSEVDAGGDEDDEDDLENVIVQQLEAIDTEVKEIILPLIVTFKQDGESILASTWWQFYDARMCIQSRLKYIFDCHARISELLIQSLLKLDGVVCATFEKARQKRKNLVKWIQEELDQIDMLRERVDQELTPVSKNAAVIIGGVIGVAAMATYALYTFSQSTTSDEDN